MLYLQYCGSQMNTCYRTNICSHLKNLIHLKESLNVLLPVLLDPFCVFISYVKSVLCIADVKYCLCRHAVPNCEIKVTKVFRIHILYTETLTLIY